MSRFYSSEATCWGHQPLLWQILHPAIWGPSSCAPKACWEPSSDEGKAQDTRPPGENELRASEERWGWWLGSAAFLRSHYIIESASAGETGNSSRFSVYCIFINRRSFLSSVLHESFFSYLAFLPYVICHIWLCMYNLLFPSSPYNLFFPSIAVQLSRDS